MQLPPTSAVVSYSGPSTYASVGTPRTSSLVCEYLPHAIGQAKQALSVTMMCSRMVSPLNASWPS